VPFSWNTASPPAPVAPNTNSDRTVAIPNMSGTLAMDGPAFIAYMSAATPIADSTWTKLRFNSELYDTNSNFDTTNYRFTPTVAGFYQVNFNWRNSAVMTASYAINRLYKNGSVALTGGWLGCSATYVSPVLSNIIYLNGSTDYIEAYAYQNSGSAIDTDYDTLYAFTGALVRAA